MAQRVTVPKDDLISKVTENRTKHKAIFDEAVEGYKKEGIKQLEAHIERIKSGKLMSVSVHLPQPVNHTRDYDRVLSMLSMEVNPTVTVDEETFASYVMDDWAWKRQFLTTNSAYSMSARQSLDDDED